MEVKSNLKSKDRKSCFKIINPMSSNKSIDLELETIGKKTKGI